ncbi:MAG: aminopeptidase, partial [Eubacteriales bacterium]|nr:aminopeptidase [Eubacteriales bacterium]
MKDPRTKKLCNLLVNYACELKPGERVLIELFGHQPELAAALVREVYAAGAEPIVRLRDMTVQRELLRGATAEKWTFEAEHDAAVMRGVQAYMGIRAVENGFETSDVTSEQNALYAKHYSGPVHGKIRVPHTRWVVLRYPTLAAAQAAKMSLEAFEDYYFNVCTLDYAKMSAAMDKLVARMERADKVHILGKGTDLTFSIKGMPAIKCDGKVNIPDGEVFSAPLRESVNGVINFNTPSLYGGTEFSDIRLTLKDGKIIEAVGNQTERLNAILNTDEGARYIGEFSFGVNPYVTEPMMDTLFDEKIAGSFHFTPGHCYDECPNGNHSDVHWDMVCIQRPEYGGGEIWLDDELVRKDGL